MDGSKNGFSHNFPTHVGMFFKTGERTDGTGSLPNTLWGDSNSCFISLSPYYIHTITTTPQPKGVKRKWH